MANEFYTILTASGRAKLAHAAATGTPLAFTQMAVGSGDNDDYYDPSESQTELKNEVWRAEINNLQVDPTNANWIVAELVIPDTVGGFTIREVGLFDSFGVMIAVGKYPASYKPTLDTGSNKQLYVRMIMEVSNTDAVTLLVDPSVVLATRQYVDSKVTCEINKLDNKQSVRVATTGAITLSGTQTIDGIALVAGDRVLVKDQPEGMDNGIYVVAPGVWTRAADADTSVEVTPGLLVSIEEGAANANSIWQLVTDAPIVLGTSALVFERTDGSTGVAAGTYRSVTVNKRGQVTGGTNPTTLADYGITDAAPKNSPELTGTPTVPTPDEDDDSKQIVNSEFVARAISWIPAPYDFTPVQQGTGIDQLSNIVKIGWTKKEGLKATVDATDQGSFVFQGALNTALADKVSGGAGIRLKWEGRGGQPTWVYGGYADPGDSALYNPASFSVNYANSAGSAPANGGTASYAHQLAGPGLVEGTIGSYRLNKNHTTSELGGAWQLRGSSYDVGSGGDWNIGTRTCLWQRVG